MAGKPITTENNFFAMKKEHCFLLTLFFLLFITSGYTQDKTINVWTDSIPGSIKNQEYKMQTIYTEDNSPRLLKVTDPVLDIYFASDNNANGTATVICPGGGYRRLAYDHEGIQIAKWLNDLGITAFILKYRLPSDDIMKDKTVGPLQDGLEAIRIVRRHAKEWNIDPNKIGIMGFSAGGHLASTVSTHYNEKVYKPKDKTSARPDFSILIYPVISMDSATTHYGSRVNLLGENPSEQLIEHFSNDLMVSKDTPPAFLVHATDDMAVPIKNSINYMFALKGFGIPTELYILEKGGHGFGMGNPATGYYWPDACKSWLIKMRFL